MQLPLPFEKRTKAPARAPGGDFLTVGRQSWPITYVRHKRARHYVLRLHDDGSVKVTIPRGGSRKDAERFARRKAEWIERERYRRLMAGADGWTDGSHILLHGEETILEVDPEGRRAVLGSETIPLPANGGADFRGPVTEALRHLAVRELPARVQELAAASELQPSSVSVRDQKSRWGSCSASGRISLNWRLIQVPPLVRDYVILHELAHLKEANHSRRFWARVEKICPWHHDARAWLKARFSGTMRDPWKPAASGQRVADHGCSS
jgi:predicted metal-dependent hydrolase